MKDDFARARADHFAGLYAGSDDPWHYRSSAYEAAKYAATIAALTRPRYHAALEIGCSIGELTALIATRAEAVTGIDLSRRAVTLARRRLRPMSHVQVERLTVPTEWPTGRWDLFVISEVIYYLSEAEISLLAERLTDARIAPAEIVIVNWNGPTDTPLSPGEAMAIFTRCLSRHMTFGRIDHPGSAAYGHHTLLERR